jgi:hypothetical protein
VQVHLQQRLGHRQQQHSRGSNKQQHSRLLSEALSTQEACPAHHLSMLYWEMVAVQLQLGRRCRQQLLPASQVVLLAVLLG